MHGLGRVAVHRHVQVERLGRGDEETHTARVVGRGRRVVASRVRLEGQLGPLEVRLQRKMSEAPCTVSTHRRPRPVGVHVAHAVRGVVGLRLVERKEPVAPHPKAARAPRLGQVGQFLRRETIPPVVDHDEVVSGTVHFRKFDDKRGTHGDRSLNLRFELTSAARSVPAAV